MRRRLCSLARSLGQRRVHLYLAAAAAAAEWSGRRRQVKAKLDDVRPLICRTGRSLAALASAEDDNWFDKQPFASRHCDARRLPL